MPLTILAFDYGTKSIGTAIGQSITQTGTELPPLPAKHGQPQWSEVGHLLDIWKPNLVLVGLPLNMDDSESSLAEEARRFGRRIHGRFGVPVEMYDERLTTREAKHEACERGHKGNYAEQPIDSIAARILLESWFRSQTAC